MSNMSNMSNKKHINEEELEVTTGGLCTDKEYYQKYKRSAHVQYRTYNPYKDSWETFEGIIVAFDYVSYVNKKYIYAIQRFPIPNPIDAVKEEDIICVL